MSSATLTSSAQSAPVYREGETPDITATFNDGATAIAKANLISLTCTLYDFLTGAIINSRSNQNVLDANNGTVATDGTLTLRLTTADMAIVASGVVAAGTKEIRVLEFTWTWNDGVAVRTGKSDSLKFYVEKSPRIA